MGSKHDVSGKKTVACNFFASKNGIFVRGVKEVVEYFFEKKA